MLCCPLPQKSAGALTVNKKTILLTVFGVVLAGLAVIQFIPAPAVVVPDQLPPGQRDGHRLLNFEGISNFRDIGGYTTEQGKTVKWGTLYRSGTLAHATPSDLQALSSLSLHTLIDFRSSAEKEEEPNRLPEPAAFEVVEIPTLDGGDNSVADEVMQRIDTGDFAGFDPDAFMLSANRQFAVTFAPQYREFLRTVIAAEGAPVAWHCSAGKDRTGFAAAILLRILGVPKETVLSDYMLSKQYALDARRTDLLLIRLFKGEEAAEKIGVHLGVERAWLEAGFDEIDKHYGGFDTYVRDGLGLSANDIATLRRELLR